MTADWVESESDRVNFGDLRLSKRFKRLLTDVYDHCRNSIPAACGGWAETIAAYRFFDNKNVSLRLLLSAHYEASVKRIGACDVVLIAQDTTQLIREVTKSTEVIKGIRKTEKVKTFLHANVAFTTERVCLGVVAADHWKRTGKKNKVTQGKEPIEEKESIRWLEGYGAACGVQAQCPNTLVVSVSDRESDIHELFLEAQTYETQMRAAWIVRSKHNRLIEGEGNHKLKGYLGKSPVRGQSEFTMPANGERRSRKNKTNNTSGIGAVKSRYPYG